MNSDQAIKINRLKRYNRFIATNRLDHYQVYCVEKSSSQNWQQNFVVQKKTRSERPEDGSVHFWQ